MSPFRGKTSSTSISIPQINRLPKRLADALDLHRHPVVVVYGYSKTRLQIGMAKELPKNVAATPIPAMQSG